MLCKDLVVKESNFTVGPRGLVLVIEGPQGHNFQAKYFPYEPIRIANRNDKPVVEFKVVGRPVTIPITEMKHFKKLIELVDHGTEHVVKNMDFNEAVTNLAISSKALIESFAYAIESQRDQANKTLQFRTRTTKLSFQEKVDRIKDTDPLFVESKDRVLVDVYPIHEYVVPKDSLIREGSRVRDADGENYGQVVAFSEGLPVIKWQDGQLSMESVSDLIKIPSPSSEADFIEEGDRVHDISGNNGSVVDVRYRLGEAAVRWDNGKVSSAPLGSLIKEAGSYDGEELEESEELEEKDDLLSEREEDSNEDSEQQVITEKRMHCPNCKRMTKHMKHEDGHKCKSCGHHKS